MPGLDSEGEDGGSRRRVRLAKLAPEKRMLAKQVHGVFESQFWDQHVSSPASMQGILPAGPCVPPPSPMLAPSGVSRAQFMIASQAVGLPVFPSYVEDEGGLVVDRVMAHAGGDGWWATLGARARAQTLYLQRHELAEALRDPRNYGICAAAKLSLDRHTTIRAHAEVLSLPPPPRLPPLPVEQMRQAALGARQQLVRWVPQLASCPGFSGAAAAAEAAGGSGSIGNDAFDVSSPSESPVNSAPLQPFTPRMSPNPLYNSRRSADEPRPAAAADGATTAAADGSSASSTSQQHPAAGTRSASPPGQLTACLEVKRKVLGGLELRGKAAVNDRSVAAAPSATPATTTTPFTLALDLGTSPQKLGGLHYRMGMYQAAASSEVQHGRVSGGGATSGAAGTSSAAAVRGMADGGADGGGRDRRFVMTGQAAVAVQGETTLWQSRVAPRRGSGGGSAKRAGKGGEAKGGAAAAAAGSGRGGKQADANAAAGRRPAAAAGRTQQQQQQQQLPAPSLPSTSYSAPPSYGRAGPPSRAPAGSSSAATAAAPPSGVPSSNIRGPSSIASAGSPIRQSLKALNRLWGGAAGGGEGEGAAGGGGGASVSAGAGGDGGARRLLPDPSVLPSPEEVTKTITDAAHALGQLRSELSHVTQFVKSGDMARQLAGKRRPKPKPVAATAAATTATVAGFNSSSGSGGGAGGASSYGQPQQQQAAQRQPWSIFINRPHIKLSGLLGLLCTAPVFTHTSLTPAPSSSPLSTPAQQHTPSTPPAAAPSPASRRMSPFSRFLGGGSPGGGGGGGAAIDGSKSPILRLLQQSNDWMRSQLSGVHFSDAVLRPYASAGASVQLGTMTRSFLDFTSCMATVQLGVPLSGAPSLSRATSTTAAAAAGSSGGGGAAGGSLLSHGAGTAAGWPLIVLGPDRQVVGHSLCVSVAQQLLGPVRLRADWRFALESSSPLTGGPYGTGAGGGGGAAAASSGKVVARDAAARVLRHVQGMRPQLNDYVYGLDVVVPGTLGAGRLVAWYSPLRRQMMLEMRLF